MYAWTLTDDCTILLTLRKRILFFFFFLHSLVTFVRPLWSIVTWVDVISPVLPHLFAPWSITTLSYFSLFRLIFKTRHVAKNYSSVLLVSLVHLWRNVRQVAQFNYKIKTTSYKCTLLFHPNANDTLYKSLTGLHIALGTFDINPTWPFDFGFIPIFGWLVFIIGLLANFLIIIYKYFWWGLDSNLRHVKYADHQNTGLMPWPMY
jgi:hypothetical protein